MAKFLKKVQICLKGPKFNIGSKSCIDSDFRYLRVKLIYFGPKMEVWVHLHVGISVFGGGGNLWILSVFRGQNWRIYQFWGKN